MVAPLLIGRAKKRIETFKELLSSKDFGGYHEVHGKKLIAVITLFLSYTARLFVSLHGPC
jgi:hypothetical protein